MEVDAFLADSVVAADGKLYVQGGVWNQLGLERFPARHPRIGVAISIAVPHSATGGEHEFALYLEDADGGRLRIADREDVRGSFSVSRSRDVAEGADHVIPLAVNLDGLVFERPGRYRFVIAVDGVPSKHLPFHVVAA